MDLPLVYLAIGAIVYGVAMAYELMDFRMDEYVWAVGLMIFGLVIVVIWPVVLACLGFFFAVKALQKWKEKR